MVTQLNRDDTGSNGTVLSVHFVSGVVTVTPGQSVTIADGDLGGHHGTNP